MTSAADLDALLSGPGAALLASLRDQALTPDTELALGTRLRDIGRGEGASTLRPDVA